MLLEVLVRMEAEPTFHEISKLNKKERVSGQKSRQDTPKFSSRFARKGVKPSLCPDFALENPQNFLRASRENDIPKTSKSPLNHVFSCY